MALNLVSIVNKGIEQAFEELDFALLKHDRLQTITVKCKDTVPRLLLLLITQIIRGQMEKRLKVQMLVKFCNLRYIAVKYQRLKE